MSLAGLDEKLFYWNAQLKSAGFQLSQGEGILNFNHFTGSYNCHVVTKSTQDVALYRHTSSEFWGESIILTKIIPLLFYVFFFCRQIPLIVESQPWNITEICKNRSHKP